MDLLLLLAVLSPLFLFYYSRFWNHYIFIETGVCQQNIFCPFYLDELHSLIRQESEVARKNADQASDPQYFAKLDEYDQRAARFLKDVENPEALGYWYFWDKIADFNFLWV